MNILEHRNHPWRHEQGILYLKLLLAECLKASPRDAKAKVGPNRPVIFALWIRMALRVHATLGNHMSFDNCRLYHRGLYLDAEAKAPRLAHTTRSCFDFRTSFRPPCSEWSWKKT